MTLNNAIKAALVSATLASTAYAADDTVKLFELEKRSIENAVEVYFPSVELANKALVSFHGELLESHKDKGYLVMQLNQQDKAKLKAFGFTFKAAKSWIEKRKQQIEALQAKALKRAKSKDLRDTIEGYPCYSTVEHTFEQAEALVTEHPQLAKWVDIGDSSNKALLNSGYDLNVLQMTNSQTAGDKPILFIHSAMHAREYTTAELTLRFAKHLLTTYGSDADSTWILDNHQVHILFHMNPDGRKMAETGLLWRKNTNTNYCGNFSNSRGADLNRNFSYFWNAANGSSGDECSDVYRGPTAGSEPETQAVEAYIRSIFADNRGENDNDAAPLDTTGMHIDVHSFSELVLWPWGHTSTPAPNATELATLGRKLAYFNDYYPMQSVGLYPTDGTSDDVSYGELGIPALTFELGTSFFQSCSAFQSKILPDNLKALKYAAKVVNAPYITPAGPDAESLTLNGQTDLLAGSGTPVTLKATIDDSRYQNSNGAEPRQNVVEAEYYINQMPWSDGASAIAMSSSDGSLTSDTEAFEAQINTQGWADGKYMLAVRGKDADGNWGAVSAIFLTIGEAPNVLPTASFTNACSGLQCSFDASNSSDSDGSISEYHWDLGDGTVKQGAEMASLSHTYSQPGDFQVKLTVTDNRGGKAEQSAVSVAQNMAPTADFSINCSNNSCQFNGSGSTDLDGSIASYQWNFGDDNTADGQSVSHTFSAAGTYNVELTVKDNHDAAASKTNSVTVTLPPAPGPTPQPTTSSGGGGSFGLAGLLVLLGGLVRRKR